MALLDAMNTFGGQASRGRVDPKSITVKSIRSVYPDVSKIQQQIFNYVVSVEFKTIKPDYFLNGDLHQKWLAQLVTKDGQYFSTSSYEKIT